MIRKMFAMAVGLVIAGECSAQSPVEQKFREVGVGNQKTVSLGVFGRLKADCTSATLPEVSVSDPPEKGVVSIKEALVKVKAGNPCAGRRIKLMLVVYVPSTSQRQKDFVKFEVIFPKKTVEHNVTLTPRVTSDILSPQDDALEL